MLLALVSQPRLCLAAQHFKEGLTVGLETGEAKSKRGEVVVGLSGCCL